MVVVFDAIERQGAVFFRAAAGFAAARERGVVLSGIGAFVVEFAADAPVVVDFVFEFEEGAAFAEFAFVPVGAEEGLRGRRRSLPSSESGRPFGSGVSCWFW